MTRFLLVSDVDSTLIEDEAIDLLANLAGSGAQVSEITRLAMEGEIDFAESLRRRVSTLAGLPEEALDAVRSSVKLTMGAKELALAIHARGGKFAAVSGGFAQLLTNISKELELDFTLANELEVKSGKLTGALVGDIVDANRKRIALEEWAAKLDLPLRQTFAIGDGANDLEMMRVAGVSIAFCAKPKVRKVAAISIADRNLAQVVSLLPRPR